MSKMIVKLYGENAVILPGGVKLGQLHWEALNIVKYGVLLPADGGYSSSLHSGFVSALTANDLINAGCLEWNGVGLRMTPDGVDVWRLLPPLIDNEITGKCCGCGEVTSLYPEYKDHQFVFFCLDCLVRIPR